MMRLGLRARLLGAVLGALVLLLSAMATVVVLRAEQGLLEVQKERSIVAVTQFAEGAHYGILAKSAVLLAPLLDAAGRLPDLVKLQVMDNEGALLGSLTLDGEAAFSVSIPVFSRQGAGSEAAMELDVLVPSSEPPALLGRVHAMFSRASINRVQADLRKDVLVAFGLLGGLCMLAVLLISSGVVGRVRQLAEAAARVSKGDFQHRVEPRGGDELEDLARDFNAMTASLRDQRHALDEVAERLAEKEALAALGRATAVIAHELRNPLGILLGAAQVAGNSERPPEARQQAANLLVAEVRRLESTLDALLSHARPRPPQRRVQAILPVCSAATTRANSPGSPAESLRIEVTGEDTLVLADEQHLHQVLLNLYINAAQAGAHTVNVRVLAAQEAVEVHLQDDGPGVDPGVQATLFRPFVTTKQRGAGLGLSGARRMMRDGGGDLRWEPSMRGAHFVVTLPVVNTEQT